MLTTEQLERMEEWKTDDACMVHAADARAMLAEIRRLQRVEEKAKALIDVTRDEFDWWYVDKVLPARDALAAELEGRP